MSKVFKVDILEHCFTTEKGFPAAGGNSMKVTIPKLMSCLSGTGPDTCTADGIFDNDKACKPSFMKKVNRLKEVQPTLSKNGNWLAKLGPDGTIPKNTDFKIQFTNGNIADCFLTTN